VLRIFLTFLLVGSLFGISVFAQEPRFATYHEIASVIVDQQISNNVTASISLQTTSIKEFQIPEDLDTKIRNNTDVIAVIITNENQCVLGVVDQICVLINTKRLEGEGGIKAAQEKAVTIGDSLIDDINSTLGLKATFHSVFIHYDDKSNLALETTGEISGRGTVSAVYTASMQSSDYMFNKISGILIPGQIRGMGGFFDVAQNLAKDDNSRVTFTILPKGQGSIMQLKVSEKYPNIAKDLYEVKPLEYLKVNEIKKSRYFSVGFFPLNSLVHLVILPMDDTTKIQTVTNVIPPTIKNNQTIPSDLSKNGWFFNSESGKKIEMVYLFGDTVVVSKNDLIVTIGEKKPVFDQVKFDDAYILIGIGAAAAGAAAYYLKGIRKKS
jgi:hypothetical protein